MASEITKMALVKALVALCSEKRLNKITIQDIADRCKVNRNTFYYHFADIYDLLDYIFKNEQEEVFKNFNNYKSFEEGFECIIKKVYEYKALILNVYNSVNRKQLEDYLHSVHGFLLNEYLNVLYDFSKISEIDTQLIKGYIKCAVVGLVLDWIDKGMKSDILKYSYKLEILIQGTLEGIGSLIKR